VANPTLCGERHDDDAGKHIVVPDIGQPVEVALVGAEGQTWASEAIAECHMRG